MRSISKCWTTFNKHIQPNQNIQKCFGHTSRTFPKIQNMPKKQNILKTFPKHSQNIPSTLSKHVQRHFENTSKTFPESPIQNPKHVQKIFQTFLQKTFLKTKTILKQSMAFPKQLITKHSCPNPYHSKLFKTYVSHASHNVFGNALEYHCCSCPVPVLLSSCALD